jgi:hypothetical protein
MLFNPIYCDDSFINTSKYPHRNTVAINIKNLNFTAIFVPVTIAGVSLNRMKNKPRKSI